MGEGGGVVRREELEDPGKRNSVGSSKLGSGKAVPDNGHETRNKSARLPVPYML